MDRNYDVITIFQNNFISGRSGVANNANIIKIAIMLIKIIFKYSKDEMS